MKSLKTAQRLCACAIVWCCFSTVAVASVTPEKQPTIWDRIHDELETDGDENGRILDIERLIRLPTLQWIQQTGNTSLFWEMVNQDDKFFIQYAGVRFLKDAGHPSAIDAAVRLCMNPEQLAGGFFGQALVYITSDPAHIPRLIELLVNHAQAYDPNSFERWVFLLAAIPVSDLEAAYADGKFNSLTASHKAYVIDAILNEGSGRLNSQLHQELALYKYFPGIPRVIYATYASEQDEELSGVIIDVLQDETVSSMLRLVVVANRKDYIRKNIDWESLELSEKLRAGMTTLLSSD